MWRKLKMITSGPQCKKDLEMATFMKEFFCLFLFLSARVHSESEGGEKSRYKDAKVQLVTFFPLVAHQESH